MSRIAFVPIAITPPGGLTPDQRAWVDPAGEIRRRVRDAIGLPDPAEAERLMLSGDPHATNPPRGLLT